MTGRSKWIIAFIDDASRLITYYGIFDRATTENTIKVLRKGFIEYGTPDEILTDLEQFIAEIVLDYSRRWFFEE